VKRRFLFSTVATVARRSRRAPLCSPDQGPTTRLNRHTAGKLRSRTLLVLAGVIAAAATAASASQATAPGKNGRIAFRRYLAPNQEQGAIFTINPNGTGERQVTHPGDAGDGDPDWSPDGSRIVFRREEGPDGAIYSVRPDGSGLKRLSPACPKVKPRRCEENFTPGFSPDGRRITYASWSGSLKGAIVIASSDGENRQVIVPQSSRAELGDSQFSPDGKRLIFTRHNIGRSAPKGGRAIFLVKTDGSGISQVTPWKLDGGDSPDWSPDGQWILFRSNVDSNKQSQLYLIHPDGTGLKQLTHFGKGTAALSSSFSPDGKWITVARTGVAGQPDVYVMRADGTGLRPVTRTKLWDSAPDWGPAR
jgi:Tol biopolymer transport system component